ncbi:hypothetical protein NYQ50_14660 [Xanthomonas translucens pv. translucens]|uniref:hypothetical protein n=1 Tax=Xanthomonas campestris pv. translucens TaxID=343 RepID=UPI000A4BCA3A|nr:hypothetical protein [Xanthomonas translucens]MCT8321716.1 hypothetical protein [Xanthomonas translucens pv. translucens]
MILVRDLLIAHVDTDADFSCECADPDFMRVAPCAALVGVTCVPTLSREGLPGRKSLPQQPLRSPRF